MENILRRVRGNLSAKFYATNDTWLTECVEYYLSEHNNPSDSEVLEFVISQWQLSDLREISNEKPCLPRNLAQEKCTTLRGQFILQMEKVYDIAESKYKQLEKIRNVSTDNIQATEVEATQAWEPKKNRMLQFCLTDGAQNVTAIEYKPIRFLNDKLLPGYKLMIKGPVTCRRGVIMLDETNVSEIGGELESLLITNATENILARALNLPENPDPYNDNNEKLNGAPKSDAPAIEDAFDDDFDIDMAAVELIERTSQEELTKAPNSHPTNTNSDVQSASASNRIVNSRVEPIIERTNDYPPIPLVDESETDIFFDALDVNEFEELPKIAPNPRPVKKTMCKNPLALPQQPDFPDSDEEFADTLEVAPEPRNVSKITCKNAVRVLPAESDFPNNDDEMILMTDDDSNSGADAWPKPSSDAKPNSEIGNMSKLKIGANSKSLAPSSAHQSNTVASALPVQVGNKRTALSPPVLKPPAEKMRCTLTTPKSSKVNYRKITDFLKKDNCPGGKISTPKITDYLKKDECPEKKPPRTKLFYDIAEVLAGSETRQVVSKTVKAKPEKLEKLTRGGDSWVLNMTLRDQTGSIDVAFSSKILENMLGFTVAEFKQKKKLKKNNPEIENQLRQGFRSAENKIKTLDALLELELAPGQKPKIVKITDVADAQKELLERTAKLRNT